MPDTTGDALLLVPGTANTWDIELKDGEGTPVTLYGPSDTLEAAVWDGGPYAALYGPTAAWIDADAGLLAVTTSSGQAAGLAPGRLLLDVYATQGGDRRLVYRGPVDVLPVPGSQTRPRCYISFGDLTDHVRASTLRTLEAPDEPPDFIKQRVDASDWLDELILDSYHPRGGNWEGYFWGASGLSQGTDSRFGLATGGYNTGRNDTLATALADGGLVVTRAIKDMVAKRALSLIYRTQVSAKDGREYFNAAAHFAGEADADALSTIVAVDTNDDGVGDIRVNLGITSMRH